MIELDEELHFNRYRAETLDAPWSSALPWTQDYRAYCVDHEEDCLKAGSWGKRWSNPSCERMFSGGDPRDLEAGAPRWKQRAIYDCIKDAATARLPGMGLARVSTHDLINGQRLGNSLDGAAELAPEALLAHVRSRSTSGLGSSHG